MCCDVQSAFALYSMVAVGSKQTYAAITNLQKKAVGIQVRHV